MREMGCRSSQETERSEKVMRGLFVEREINENLNHSHCVPNLDLTCPHTQKTYIFIFGSTTVVSPD